MNRTRMLRGAVSALAVVCGLTLASPPSAQADTTLSYTTYVDANGEKDTLLVTSAAPSSAPLPADNTVDRSSICWRVTATARMSSHVGVTLWTATSAATFCRMPSKITFFSWEPPTYHITSTGQAVGWQFDGSSRNKNRIGPCLVIGNSIIDFKQTYPFGVGQIGSARVKHHLETFCSKPFYRWSS